MNAPLYTVCSGFGNCGQPCAADKQAFPAEHASFPVAKVEFRVANEAVAASNATVAVQHDLFAASNTMFATQNAAFAVQYGPFATDNGGVEAGTGTDGVGGREVKTDGVNDRCALEDAAEYARDGSRGFFWQCLDAADAEAISTRIAAIKYADGPAAVKI